MKKIKFIIYSLLVALVFSSCATYNAPTRYQGKNLYKFSQRKRTAGAGKVLRNRSVALHRTGSYLHPAVPDQVRRYLRARTWMEGISEGQLYK